MTCNNNSLPCKIYCPECFKMTNFDRFNRKLAMGVRGFDNVSNYTIHK